MRDKSPPRRGPCGSNTGCATEGGMTSSAKGDADRPCLAARFVEGPRLFAPDEAQQRLAGWLGDLAPEQASAIRGFADRFPLTRTILEGIAEASSYLFDLMRADAARLIRLLGCDPESHLTELIARTSLAVVAAADEAEAMQLLRRMKSEAALLIALCDIGGVWPVMRVTAGLTDLAVASVQSALRYLLRQEAARGRLSPPDAGRPEDGSGLVVLAMGKMGAGELNYSSDIDLIVFFDSTAPTLAAGHRAAAVFRAGHAGLGAAAAAAHRRRLRVPRRFAAAAGSGLDPGGDVDRGCAALLRAGRAHLGARRHDQGAACAGDAEAGEALLADIAPFVWRKHLDFAALADVHDMKRRMQTFRGQKRDCRRRPQRQGRARRHPRDRVFRADPAIDRGRPASGIAGAADAGGAEGAGVEQLDHLCRAR